jgi:signal transduction histidine kinase
MRGSPSIGRKLTWVTALSSATALLAAGLALVLYDLYEVRRALVARVRTVGDFVSISTSSALDFNDRDTATAMLSALKAEPAVVSAGILVDGTYFATYGRDGAPPPVDRLPSMREGQAFTDRHLFVFQPITLQGRSLGTLMIQSDLREVGESLRRHAATISIVAAVAVLVATMISRTLQDRVSRPLLELSAVAQTVSDQKDYSVRAPVARSTAEIERLVGTFNLMLAEIQDQHGELGRAQSLLEQRVEERTRELGLRGKELEARSRELAAANKELEAFSYSVSHDLRAPLRAIDGFSKALLTGYPNKTLDEKGIHFLERVRAGTQKMASLIDDMLHLARVTRSTLKRQDISLTTIAGDVGAELARRHPDRTVRLDVEDGLQASADSHLVTIVFENLLGNAWKFTGKNEDARIEVGRRSNGDEAAYYVRDNGAGFNMQYAQKLFGAFQRLHTDSEFEGTGIGLATVQRIVTRHGGRIWAEAEEGRGATFYFTLGEGS